MKYFIFYFLIFLAMPVCCYECLPSNLIGNGTIVTSNKCLTDANDDGRVVRCNSMTDACGSGTMSKALRKN